MASVGSENGDTVSLNVMPMLDIFSILILFLLMSFSTEPVSYDITKGVELPVSNTLVSLDEVPSVRITSEEILVNDKSVATLRNGKISDFDNFQGAVLPVFRELSKLAEANKKIRKKSAEDPMELTFEVHKDHSFKLIKRVMKSAQQADFIKFNLMVEKES